MILDFEIRLIRNKKSTSIFVVKSWRRYFERDQFNDTFSVGRRIHSTVKYQQPAVSISGYPDKIKLEGDQPRSTQMHRTMND